MGLVYADIELINTVYLGIFYIGFLSESAIKRRMVHALVNTRAYMLAINEHIREQLDLRKITSQEAVLADGMIKRLDIVGPLDIKYENRETTVSAVVLHGENEVLPGAIPIRRYGCTD